MIPACQTPPPCHLEPISGISPVSISEFQSFSFSSAPLSPRTPTRPIPEPPSGGPVAANPKKQIPVIDGKGTLYEGGIRVPLMWAWAGKIAPGSISEAIVGPIDRTTCSSVIPLSAILLSKATT